MAEFMDSLNIPEQFNVATYLLDRHVHEGREDKVAVYYKDQSLTYGQMAEMANRSGNVLNDLGVEGENRILLCVPDCPEFLAVYFGAMKIGAVPVPVNTMATGEDLVYYLNDSRAKILVTTADVYDLLAESSKPQNFLRHVVLVDKPRPGCHVLTELLSKASPQLEAEETSRNDMAFWLYSSGTTGTPKGVVHLHHDLPYFMSPLCEEILQLSPDDLAYSTSKMFFSYGRNNSLDSVFLTGTSVVLSPERPTPENILRVLHTYKPTILYSVPSSYSAILKHVAKLDDMPDLSSLRLCVSAGEALPQVVFEQWKETFGVDILDGVGSSDVGAIYMCNTPGEIRPGSCGKVIPGFESRLLDEDGQEVVSGEIGTLWVRNHGTTPGYWNKHTKTQQVICHDWFSTGDQFYRDDDGYFYFAGRGDDLIKPGGIWMSPLEVEGILLRHPAVGECGVTGVKDAQDLEKPVAFVVLNSGYGPDQELEHELKEYVRQTTAHYKCPRWIQFVDSLPRTATGKLQRYKLKKTQD